MLTGARSGAAADRAIKADWSEFFSAKTSDSKRVKLLQNGSEFAPVISAQSGSPLASQVSAKVSKVSVTKPASRATVRYSLLLAGKPALRNQKGTAVYQSGTWKVGTASFCGLLALENGGSTASLPAACRKT